MTIESQLGIPIFFGLRMGEELWMPKPGQKTRAMVEGREVVVILSLETEEKGDRRDHCWRRDEPWYPIIPRGVGVAVLGPYIEPLRAPIPRKTQDQ